MCRFVVSMRARYLWCAVNMNDAWMGLERVEDPTNRGESELAFGRAPPKCKCTYEWCEV